MPFGGGHLADVAREGIWASLTGGWYYEPAHSMFANTLHLYIWALLLVLPLLFGLSANNNYHTDNASGQWRFNTGFALAYLAIVAALFVLVKLAVSWLHHIFDTVQPIKYRSKKRTTPNEQREEAQQRRAHAGRFSGSSFSATRATETNPLDMIEMLELSQQQQRSPQRHQQTPRISMGHHPPRTDREEEMEMDEIGIGTDGVVVVQSATEEEEDEGRGGSSKPTKSNRNTAAYLSLPSFDQHRHRHPAGGPIPGQEDNRSPSSSSSSSSSSSFGAAMRSANGLLLLESSAAGDGGRRYQHRRSWRRNAGGGGGGGRGLLDTADSLELIPTASRNNSRSGGRRRTATGGATIERGRIQRQLANSAHLRAHSQQRKYSEPAVTSTTSCSATTGGGARHWRNRARRRSEEKLREHQQRPPQGAIRRVYSTVDTRGGGILVDELELIRLGGPRRGNSTGRMKQKQRQREATTAQKQAEARHRIEDTAKAKETGQEEDPEQQQPCCSSSIFVDDGNGHQQERSEQEAEKTKARIERQSTAHDMSIYPPFSLAALQQGTLQTADLASHDSSTGSDLKGQITKFLEDLIARHPEAIDAIESVRTNRLFQQGARGRNHRGNEDDDAEMFDHPLGRREASLNAETENDRQSTEEPLQRRDIGEAVAAASSIHNTTTAAGRYLAVDPADTSQGAVHTFQDAHGNWFTYWFDPQGSGTAQPLHLAPAITEMFAEAHEQRQQQRAAVAARTSHHQHKPLTRTLAHPVTHGPTEDEDANRSIAFVDVPEQLHQQPTVVNVIETNNKQARDVEKASKGKRQQKRIRQRRLTTSSTTSSSSSSSSSSTATSFSSSTARRHGLRTHDAGGDGSSSDEAGNQYLRPANVLHLPAGIRRGTSGLGMRAVTAGTAATLPPQLQQPAARTHGRQLSDSSRTLLAFMHRLCQGAGGGGGTNDLELDFTVPGRASSSTAPSQAIVAASSSSASARNSASAVMAMLEGLETMRHRHNLSASVIESVDAVDQQQLQLADTPHMPRTSSPVNTVRLLNDLQLARTVPPGLLLYHATRDALANSRLRLKYCYRLTLPRWLHWWPFGGSGAKHDGDGGSNAGADNDAGTKKVPKREFKLKLDRLSLAALFDRNTSPLSCAFDVLLAMVVAALTTLILSRHIYTELSLLVFAFVVAGAQFSLLKSVQPDSASPVHGFNWQVTYSRPAYFILLASALLLLDWLGGSAAVWHWRPPWLRLFADRAFAFSPRDFCANALLFLPLAFTLGLLPQVNTLCMHVLEQLDMHLFGATASLSLFSAMFSATRSICTVGALTGTLALIQRCCSAHSNVAGSIGFSAFVALTNATAYLLSRASSNPQFVRLLFEAIWRRLKKHPTKESASSFAENPNNTSQSTLSGGGGAAAPARATKQLLTCCISTNSNQPGTATVSRRRSCTVPATAGQDQQQQQRRKAKRQRADTSTSRHSEKAELAREEAEQELLSGQPIHTLMLRAQHDLFSAVLRALILFGIHCTLVFRTGQPQLEKVLAVVCILLGLTNHHVYPQLRARNPWKCFAHPILRPWGYGQFESKEEARLCAFERVHAWMLSMEKNIFHPLLIASLMSSSGTIWNSTNFWTLLVMTTCAFRLARTGFAQPNMLPFALLATCVIHAGKIGVIEDSPSSSPFTTPLFCLFLATIIWAKLLELLLKIHFILCYIAPWQISWGSAFHAFAQPFSVPHSGLTLAHCVLSSLLSAPLNPFLGSSFFLMSYIRPVKFWERDYNTKRMDHTKLRLASQLDRGPMIDDSNLNAIFYEHLTRSLQKSLAGDLLLGRWACTVRPGDCFILASSYLNCMVQLVEVGNGFVTFQLRGLEFRGTYCHQREMEAISEDWADNNGACCCCSLGRLPAFISFNSAWALRWLAWEVTVPKYVVDGYSITDNSAVNMLQVHEYRRKLVSLYVKCMIYYAISSPQLAAWLSDETICKALELIKQNPRFVDTDPVFCAANDEDYDLNSGGLSRHCFALLYADWIKHCVMCHRNPPGPVAAEAAHQGKLLTFCFALSILGRRALGTAAYNRHASAAESFLFGMHALFKGDMRIVHQADEWVFASLDILERVIAPSVRMALKLHQDHFMGELEESWQLYDQIAEYTDQIFISHEHDPEWRRAILANTPSLLALRHICDDGQDDYKVIMLNRRHLDMRVIKLNKECVRAFWAGQQQELIFLRNKNPERGSIQNARQVLRNMINSSADQPIGYPIYVSPLCTSFVETHHQLSRVLGPPLTVHRCWRFLCSAWARLRANFGPSGSSSAANQQQQQIPMTTFSASTATPTPSAMGQPSAAPPATTAEAVPSTSSAFAVAEPTVAKSGRRRVDKLARGGQQQQHRQRRQQSLSNSLFDNDRAEQGQQHNHPKGKAKGRRSSAADADACGSSTMVEDVQKRPEIVQIEDPDKIFPSLNEPLRCSAGGNRLLVHWPRAEWRALGGASGWPAGWLAYFGRGARGRVVHRWSPFHADRAHRSHAGHILLLEVAMPKDDEAEECERKDDDECRSHCYVPILAEGVKEVK